jgi:hypothetical protein
VGPERAPLSLVSTIELLGRKGSGSKVCNSDKVTIKKYVTMKSVYHTNEVKTKKIKRKDKTKLVSVYIADFFYIYITN